MELLITHQSAIEYWRLCRNTGAGDDRRRRRSTLPVGRPDAGIARQLGDHGLTYPIQALVGRPEARRSTRLVRTRVLGGRLPEGCIVDAGSGLYVASPELCFFQMAGELPFARLLELGCELCGSYALPVGDNGDAMGDAHLYNRRPLTSVSKLKAALARIGGRVNQRYLQKALRLIADDSASPMETRLFLLLTLPFRHGGFGFAMPRLNAKVTPGPSERQLSSKQFFRCDLFWKDHSLAMEYDSNLKHLSPAELAADAMKRNSLRVMGIEVMTVTSKQVLDARELEKTARQLAAHMGRRLRISEGDRPGFAEAHRNLRNLLRL